ncbi:MAG: recombination associated protein RdgC [Alteromonadaceae bacterium]|jgi:recombination associated protein RdgC
MWFSNIYFFKFTQPFETSQEELEKSLDELKFTPCGTLDLSKFGWTSALGNNTSGYTHEANGNIYLRAKKEEKILPASVIKDLLEEKVANIEKAESRPVKKKEKEQIKEDIIHSLLPQAFTKSSYVSGYIDTNNQLLLINVSSKNKADDFMSLLRKAIGTLPVEPVRKDGTIELLLTHWLKDQALPDQFSLEMEAELKSPEEDGAVVKVKQQDLTADEITRHMETGKQVTKLALLWQERVSFIIQDDISIKRVKFGELIKEQNDDIPSDDKLAKMDADFTLMAAEFGELIPYIIKEVGE